MYRALTPTLLITLQCILTFGISETSARTSDSTKVGVYVTSLYDLDYSNGSFTVEYWLWRLNKKREFKNYYEFNTTETKSEEKLSSSTEWKDQSENQFIHDGDTLFWDYENFRAVVRHDFNIANYPFDEEILEIEFEGSTYTDDWVKVVLDLQNSGKEPIKIDGWEVGKFKMEKVVNKYSSNFGSPLDTGRHAYTGFKVTIPIKREGTALFIKLFSGLVVAFVIALFSLRINITEADGRFGVCVGALFAALANMYIVNDNLPVVSKFTFMDKAHIVTIFLILFLFITSTVSLKYFKADKLAFSQKVDKIAIVIASAIFLIGILSIWPY